MQGASDQVKSGGGKAILDSNLDRMSGGCRPGEGSTVGKEIHKAVRDAGGMRQQDLETEIDSARERGVLNIKEDPEVSSLSG